MIKSIIQPKTPIGKGWTVYRHWQKPKLMADLGYPVVPWLHDSGIFVLSALEVVKPDQRQEELGPEWHLSISFKNGRCDRNQAKWVLKEFGLEDAEEDNHVPGGFVRNYWRSVADKYSGYECPCKDEEPAMVEDKGDFVWRGITK